jgi:hypothetical protein
MTGIIHRRDVVQLGGPTPEEPMNQHTDTHAQRARRLSSEVQRLRDWAGGDPARLGGVADALIELTAHRLAAHAWAEAAPSAQEAVVLSAKVLAQHGPVGPYTPRADAARSVTALVQLAVIQSAAGLLDGAEQTLSAAFGLRAQLTRLDLDAALDPATIAWALLTWARVAWAGGDLAAANARADAAVSVGVEGPLGVDVDRLVSDVRWAAGWPQPSVEHALRAVEHFDADALAVLSEPAGAPAAMLERLSEPLFGLYADAADRVLVIGAPGLALTLRRRLVDLLGTLAVRRPEVQPLLVTALDDLAHDLRSVGRAGEAEDLADLADSIAAESAGADAQRPAARVRAPLGEQVSWSSLPAAEVFGVEVGATGEAIGRLAALRGPADAVEQQVRAEAEAELAARARSAAEQQQRAEREAASRAEREQREAAQAAEAQRLAEQQAAEAEEVERLENQRRRAERIAEHEREAEREAAEREAALRARVSDETPDERAEREELERLAAELAALEAAEAAELAAIERELAEAEVVEAAEEQLGRAEVFEAEALDEAEQTVEREAERVRLEAERAEAERAQAELAAAEAERERLEAERREAERVAAAQAEFERAEAERQRADEERRRAEAEWYEGERRERERVAAEQEAERVELERAQAELAAAEAERERLEAERREAERVAAAEAEWYEGERRERERVAAEHEAERQRAEQAEREAAEQAERGAEREAAERAEVERLAAEQAERQAAERAEAESVEAEQASLDQVREGVEQASGRREVRVATEALVDELRGRYEADPDSYLADYLDALDQLATARWQAGDWWGSRGPSKEAKALRKQHGL